MVSAEPDVKAVTELLERHALAADPYLRAAVLWAAANEIGLASGSILAHALDDPHELVRDTAVQGARHILELAETEMLAGSGDGSGPRQPPAAMVRVEGETRNVLTELWNAIASDPKASFSSLPTIEKMQFLRCVPLFSDLDPEDLHELSLIAEQETVAPPQVLCEEGDTESDDLYILIDGRASVVVAGKDGANEVEHEVAVLEAGAVIGELSLLDGSPRSATVRPQEGPLRLLRIPGQFFRTRMLHRQRVTRPLMTSMARIIRSLLLRTADARDQSSA